MTCARIREHLPSLLDDRLATAAAREIRAHLAGCPDCEREFTTLSQTLIALDAMPAPTPSPRLRARVYAAIAAEQHALRNPVTSAEPAAPVARKPATRSGRSLWFWLVQPLAAAALLVLGFTLGNRSIPATAPVTLPSATPTTTPAAADAATQRELADLRKKVDSMSQLVGYSLLQQQSRSSNERLRGVLTSAAVEKPDDKTINDLIGALALDPSANVRLNALEALYPHADQEVVRAGVLTSLPREQSPLVQISMIDFLVASRDREATPALQKLSANPQADLNVREAAKRALTQL
ncbi:MAG: zf-HC2 domain-containing protein [Undibacterium sp.]|nr:zf-HC2 domain-containing protein [Opitutaceae bacterium]